MKFRAEGETFDITFTVGPVRWFGLWLFKTLNYGEYDYCMEALYWYTVCRDARIEARKKEEERAATSREIEEISNQTSEVW